STCRPCSGAWSPPCWRRATLGQGDPRVIRSLRLLASLAILLHLFGASALAQPDDFDHFPTWSALPGSAADAGAGDVVPGRVLVTLREPAEPDGAWREDMAARGAASPLEAGALADDSPAAGPGVRRLAVEPGSEAAVAEALGGDPRVEWAEPDYRLH